MLTIAIASGKGGTGKTTIAAALAHLASQNGPLVMVDADVDAPNLGLLLQPRNVKKAPFFGGKKATIIADLCNECGRCVEVCRFQAVARCARSYRIAPLDCEGCASCFYACPTGAIRMQDSLSGYWHHAETRFGPLFYAELLPGAENSSKMVSTLRQEAILLAQQCRTDWILVDGAPGVGCPVIAAVTGMDLALIVSEPTVSGVLDLIRALRICEHFRVPTTVAINKADINSPKSDEIAAHCLEHGIPLAARIPYDDLVIDAMRRGRAVTELGENGVAREIKNLWLGLCDHAQRP